MHCSSAALLRRIRAKTSYASRRLWSSTTPKSTCCCRRSAKRSQRWNSCLLQPPDFYLHDIDLASHDGRFGCEVIRTIHSGARRLTLVKLDRPPAEGED